MARIFILDGDVQGENWFTHELEREFLRQKGHHVTTAYATREALSQTALQHSDILLIAHEERLTGGLSAGDFITAAKKCNPALQVIYMANAGNEPENYKAKAAAMGADGFHNLTWEPQSSLPQLEAMIARMTETPKGQGR